MTAGVQPPPPQSFIRYSLWRRAMGFNLIGERVFVHQTRLQPQRININGPPKARERECARRAEYARLNIQITAAILPGEGVNKYTNTRNRTSDIYAHKNFNCSCPRRGVGGVSRSLLILLHAPLPQLVCTEGWAVLCGLRQFCRSRAQRLVIFKWSGKGFADYPTTAECE